MAGKKARVTKSTQASLLQSRLPSFLGSPFLDCTAPSLRRHGASAVFLGVPYDQATVYRSGSSHGPKGVRSVSEQFLPYLGEFDVDVFERFRLADCGDVPVVAANAQRSRDLIKHYVAEVLSVDAVPICVGGDHSIPIPIFEAVCEKWSNGRVGYLHFDSHLDAQDEVAGERFTNWSGVARATEQPNVDPSNIALVGIKGALNPREHFDFVQSRGIALFSARDVAREGVEAIVSRALDVVTHGTDAFYVTWDTDVIDSSAFPGTDAPEPGGFTPREALRAIELVGGRRPVALDIVELIPAYDHPSMISARFVCYLILNFLGGYALGTDVEKLGRDQAESNSFK